MGWSESIECGVSSIGGVMALGRAEHPCSAAAGQGWPALPKRGMSGWRLAVRKIQRETG